MNVGTTVLTTVRSLATQTVTVLVAVSAPAVSLRVSVAVLLCEVHVPAASPLYVFE